MARKLKKYKVGIDSETFAVSIVDEPAIESDFVALKKDEQEQMFFGSDERHMLYGAALIPDKDIYRNNGEQEFYINFTKESIEKMAQDFMKNYRQNEVTLDHEEQANDITIVESWLVEDPYRDKANALGINVPQGTWMLGMKVNQIDVWDRVKSGELKGFSVESLISLEEFSKQNNEENKENMIQLDEMSFWSKMKETLIEVFSKKEEEVELHQEPLEEPKAVETTVEEPKAEEPVVEEPKTVEEPKVEEPKEEPKAEEPKTDGTAQLEELIKSLKDEINALKESNNSLSDKVKEMSKQPSTKPLNTNSKPSGAATGVDSSAYQSWREQMRQMY